ncbi:MarR family winged helix-turn-helix transcriptional regulator [Kitasatospora sp. NPDC050463]|uniref:MarR family winged helix-turn-helix transcriptional regulator n=1 Tax=Kitasatospora sp. NPDC050463 TaxID=3155786 RepID=UPI0033F35C85
MIERLVAVGVVAREGSSEDRREVRTALTGAGARTVADAADRWREEIAHIVASMPAHQRAGVIDALHRFAEAVGGPSVQVRQVDVLGW